MYEKALLLGTNEKDVRIRVERAGFVIPLQCYDRRGLTYISVWCETPREPSLSPSSGSVAFCQLE